MMKLWATLSTLSFIVSASAIGQTAPDILKNAINTPSIAYSVYGPGQTTKIVKDKGVIGGQAFRIDVKKAANAFAVGASSAITKPIAKGDRITMAFWARAPKLADGETTALPFVGVTGNQAPYTQIAQGSAEITNTWAIHQAKGVAPEAFTVGTATVTLHLAAADAIIDLGPVFVLDFGAKP